MSSRPLIKPFYVIGGATGASGDMSGNITSKPTVIDDLSMLSYDISWTGSSPVGSMSIQVSNSYSQNADGSVRVAGNWTTVTLSSPTNVSGNSGSGFIDIDALGAYAVRLVYTRVSGTGNMQAVVACKVT